VLILALLACRVDAPPPAAPTPAAPDAATPAPSPAPTPGPGGAPSASAVAPGAGGPSPRSAPLAEDADDPPLSYTVPVDGPCERTVIEDIGTRTVDGDGTPDLESGVTVIFANGLMLVGYSRPMLVESQKPGDKVEVCLVEVPVGCPPGDTRGKVYRVRDLRAGQSYTLPDAMHMCGGA
jgi:hypothetical protein